MLIRRMLFGSTALRAPENDQGGEDPDLELDDELEPDSEPDEDLDPDPEDEGLDLDPEDPDEAPARQLSRGDNRVAKATREAAEARDRAEAAERRAADLERQAAQNQQPRETPQQFQARLDAMEPWDRTEYLRQLDRQASDARLARIEFDSWDRGDKVAYESLASREPIAAKLKDDVERVVQERRKLGQNVDRETVLKYLIGERALANKGRATGKAQRTATAQRERQTARPANGRADAAPDTGRRGGSEAAQRAKRLADMEI